MKLRREGSMLLTFFLVLSSLTLACSLVWLAAILFFDVALQKQSYESSYQQTGAILKYGISLCKNNFDTVRSYLKNNKALVVDVPLHGVKSSKDRLATVRMTLRDEQCIILQACVQEKEKTIFENSCELIKHEETASDGKDSPYYAISAWKKNNA